MSGASKRSLTQVGRDATGVGREVMVSADSHVMEAPDLWEQRLPRAFRDRSPRFAPHKVGEGFQAQPGGTDPAKRLDEMAADGVSGEVLYPTLGLHLYHLEDTALQEACFRVFNDWLIEYCSVAPERLVGVAMISTYDIQRAIEELERCRKNGMRGAMVWLVPPQALSFTTAHYDPFWAAAERLEMPISLHVLTGFGRNTQISTVKGLDLQRSAVNLKLQEVMNALFDIVYSGVLERFPALKLVLVEHEVGWLSFVAEQWDKYFNRGNRGPLPISRPPSEYVSRQVYATFFNDPVGGYLLSRWGADNCMWSNDYPHPNSTWPRSREVVARDLGHLSPEARAKVLRLNVQKLYGLHPDTSRLVSRTAA